METKKKGLATRVPAFQNNLRRSKSSESDSGISSICEDDAHDCELPRGIDQSLLSYEIPNAIDQESIISQAEYYFSDDYLAKDAYFLRQIKRKKEGYLSMKLITNFKKLRKMVRDVRVTAYCLRKSTLLLVNEEGTKVKRRAPIPESLQRVNSCNRSAIVNNLSPHMTSIEKLTKYFVKYGELVSVRIAKSDKMIQVENLPLRYAQYAVIEFESLTSARAACLDSTFSVELMSNETPACKNTAKSLLFSYNMWMSSLSSDTDTSVDYELCEDDNKLINDIFNYVLAETAQITL